jgi:hypothetical protein
MDRSKWGNFVSGKFDGQGVYTYNGGGTLSRVWGQGQFVPNKIQ